MEKKLPGWAVLLTVVGAIVLLVVGVLVLSAGRDMWEHPGPPQVSHPTKATFEVVKTPVKVVKRNGETRRKFSASKRVKTVEREAQISGRSDTVALAILATGAALLLAGGFAARLTRLKLPGVELEAALLSREAGFQEGAITGVAVGREAKERGTTDVLEEGEKLIEAVNITRVAGMGKGRSAAITAATLKLEPTLTLETADEEELKRVQEAAGAAVQTVSDEV